MEITLRLFPGGFHRFSTDANLTVQHDPIKRECRLRILRQVSTFLTFVVSEKYEAVVIEPFEKERPNRRCATGRSGSEAHGVYIADLGLDRRRKPIRELLNRVWIQIPTAQSLF